MDSQRSEAGDKEREKEDKIAGRVRTTLGRIRGPKFVKSSELGISELRVFLSKIPDCKIPDCSGFFNDLWCSKAPKNCGQSDLYY